MNAKHVMLVGLSYRTTMQVCHSNIEQSALLRFVQNHKYSRRLMYLPPASLRAGETKLVEGNTLVTLSKSDFMGIEVARQTFSKFQSNQQNCNEP